MSLQSANDVFTPAEIALAAGVSETQVLAALYGGRLPLSGSETAPAYVGRADAVRIGRILVGAARCEAGDSTACPPKLAQNGSERRGERPVFSLFAGGGSEPQSNGLPLAVSSTLHVGMLGFIVFLTTFNLAPRAAALKTEDSVKEPMRLVFHAIPGPGGGGGGGGLLQKAPPPKALREGPKKISSPIPLRREPKPIAPAPPAPKPAPPPPPPLAAEPLPVIVAPIVAAPADTRNRVGVMEQTPVDTDSHGSGRGGGAGSGNGTGVGPGDGSGVGPGSGGGTGGGPYRPGSGIEAPRLLREVRADYTEEARQRGIRGDVVLEIVVRRDGGVGDIKILQGLGAGLNDRAVQAVRQWRFAPATRLGQPVDVIVEVAVEFKLR